METLTSRAFAADDGDAAEAAGLTRAEWSLYLEVQPALELWVGRLGVGCLEALAPLEDRALPAKGRRPTDSTYRARRKFPQGTLYNRLRVDEILDVVKSHAQYGLLDADRATPDLTLASACSPNWAFAQQPFAQDLRG